MPNSAVERLNRKLGGTSGENVSESGSTNSGSEKDAIQTVADPGEAFGSKTTGQKDSEKTGEGKPRGWPKGKKRGPRKGRSGTAAKENKTVIEGVASTLVGVHFFMANAFDAAEFELEQDEAEKIALAVQRVSDQYGQIVDPKTEAWLGLVGILGACYGPRVVMYNMRKKAQQKRREAQANMTEPPEAPTARKSAPPATVKQTKPKTSSKDAGLQTPGQFYGPINTQPDEGPIQ